MKLLLTALLSISLLTTGKYEGVYYVMSQDTYYDITFNRDYIENGNVFETKYELYNDLGQSSYHVLAKHDKSKRLVTVQLIDPNAGIFSIVCEEKFNIKEYSTNPMGIRGNVGMLGGKRVPDQLSFRFVSDKYENIKVINMNATEAGTSDFRFLILDQ